MFEVWDTPVRHDRRGDYDHSPDADFFSPAGAQVIPYTQVWDPVTAQPVQFPQVTITPVQKNAPFIAPIPAKAPDTEAQMYPMSAAVSPDGSIDMSYINGLHLHSEPDGRSEAARMTELNKRALVGASAQLGPGEWYEVGADPRMSGLGDDLPLVDYVDYTQDQSMIDVSYVPGSGSSITSSPVFYETPPPAPGTSLPSVGVSINPVTGVKIPGTPTAITTVKSVPATKTVTTPLATSSFWNNFFTGLTNLFTGGRVQTAYTGTGSQLNPVATGQISFDSQGLHLAGGTTIPTIFLVGGAGLLIYMMTKKRGR